MLSGIDDPRVVGAGRREPQKIVVLREDYPSFSSGTGKMFLIAGAHQASLRDGQHIDAPGAGAPG